MNALYTPSLTASFARTSTSATSAFAFHSPYDLPNPLPRDRLDDAFFRNQRLDQAGWRDVEGGVVDVDSFRGGLASLAVEEGELLGAVRRIVERIDVQRDLPWRLLERGDELINLSNASVATERKAFARVAQAAHRIEEFIQRGKSEAGLGDYEVRSWPGWYHHQTLSMIAARFLMTETRRGKYGLRPPRHRRSAGLSRCCCTRPPTATGPRTSRANERAASHESNSPACTTGNDVTSDHC